MQGVSQPAHSSTDVETHGCANGASNVKQTNRVLMERGDLSWYEVRPGQATHTRTHTQSYSSRKCDESSLAFHAPADTMPGSMFSHGADEEDYFSQALHSSCVSQ